MSRTDKVLLEFNSELNLGKKKLRDGLSAVVQIGDALWVAKMRVPTTPRACPCTPLPENRPTPL
ncbi:hypothetical protein NVV94_11065 [Pseudomonas sp. LS1212]|uniref:hypothetical protein n=1 Tax=Pseudomonas sp. LS1212 TaxID=2972478 RepID=UPI00215D22B5|nr:hypothetical protein [Pseudomonas sp. LS1212]UVJ46031.1 hypothetical protein NVV94_11065 [Pseudomonas sp. LS1212]